MTALACDIGGTNIKLGLVAQGRVLQSTSLPSGSDRPLRERLTPLAEACEALCRQAHTTPSACAGIAVGFPALVDRQRGRILTEHGKYCDGPAVDLPAWARQRWNIPLALENDASLALIGEWRNGAGRGCDNLVMITLGTGIGTAVILEGRVLRGRHGQAGNLGGHLVVNFDGRAGPGTVAGSVESESSSLALPEIARSLPGFPDSRLTQIPRLDYEAVFRLAAENDAGAVALRQRTLAVWSALVISLIHAFDPERILVGGGIMRSADVIVPVLAQAARSAYTPWGQVTVAAGELGDNAALLGAEWLLQERFE